MAISTIGAGAVGPVELIYSATAGSGGVASFDTGTIDVSDYRSLQVIVSIRTDDSGVTATGASLFFNGDETLSNYYGIYSYQGISSANAYTDTAGTLNDIGFGANVFVANAADAGASIFSNGVAQINSPSGAYTVVKAENQGFQGAASGTQRTLNRYAQVWKNTASITRIVLKSHAGGNFVEHSTCQILGVK